MQLTIKEMSNITDSQTLLDYKSAKWNMTVAWLDLVDISLIMLSLVTIFSLMFRTNCAKLFHPVFEIWLFILRTNVV